MKKNSAKVKYLKMCEDWFGLFDRSAAAKKGWETRKQNGWDPKVGLSDPGAKIPSYAGVGAGNGSSASLKTNDQKMKHLENEAKKEVEEGIASQPDVKRFRELADWNAGRKGDEWIG